MRSCKACKSCFEEKAVTGATLRCTNIKGAAWRDVDNPGVCALAPNAARSIKQLNEQRCSTLAVYCSVFERNEDDIPDAKTP